MGPQDFVVVGREKKIFFVTDKKIKKNLPKVPDTLARVTKANRVILGTLNFVKQALC